MTQKQEIFTLLGGRVQIRRGRYNPTSDAVWLAAMAASVNARTVLDVGVGTGGAILCLTSWQPDIIATGLDISPEMLAECADNATLNHRDIELINADITTWRTDKTFDLVISNPPYFNGTPATHNAHHNADLDTWTRRCVARTRPRGTFITIVDAAASACVISAMTHSCGGIELFPLFGAKNTAERVIISGRVGIKSPSIIHRGLSMNTDAVLRDGLTIRDALSKLGIT
ncbi:methyltransferase domain-containing protein [bacterium]|nr:methyltransferase domain-containing protein [bacterium]